MQPLYTHTQNGAELVRRIEAARRFVKNMVSKRFAAVTAILETVKSVPPLCASVHAEGNVEIVSVHAEGNVEIVSALCVSPQKLFSLELS